MKAATGRWQGWAFCWPLLWTCLIIWASSDNFSAQQTGGLLQGLLGLLHLQPTAAQLELLHLLLRKLGHLTAYGSLAWLWVRAFLPVLSTWPKGSAWLLALVFTGLTASWDEWHQSLLSNRTGAWSDVIIDLTGALISLGIYALLVRKNSAPSAGA